MYLFIIIIHILHIIVNKILNGPIKFIEQKIGQSSDYPILANLPNMQPTVPSV